MKIVFVINPKSGTAERKDYRTIISRASRNMDFEWCIYETTGKGDPEQIRSKIKDFHPDIVIAVGGDGTVNMVAVELIGTGIKLGIIPAGSANGLARNLDIPEDFVKALNFNLNASSGFMDIIKINDTHYCLHLSDIGINARIVKRFEKSGSKGLTGYGKQLFKELTEGKTSFSFSIQISGQPRKKMKAEMVVIANAKRFGTGAIINPGGTLNDGKFEIIIIRPYPWWFVFSFVYAAFLGKLHKMKYAKVFSASEVALRFPETHDIQVDGEIISGIDSLKIEIVPGAINVAGVQ